MVNRGELLPKYNEQSAPLGEVQLYLRKELLCLRGSKDNCTDATSTCIKSIDFCVFKAH